MYGKKVLVAAVLLVLALPSVVEGKHKKKQVPRGMLESMQSVPCGVKERGLTGLGSIFGSVGVQHVNSNEKLCPQYLLRTDELDYHIRPLDMKHAVLLPIGHEGEFKIKKDRMFLKVPDEDKKARAYQVVSVEPVKSQAGAESTAYRFQDKPTGSRPTDRTADRVANQKTNPLPPP
ncbi:MAG TPA: hypothetical protein VEK84_03355 [Terriglobales bacterium]|nr:hypothetical protein [Terriglobales bacterium]